MKKVATFIILGIFLISFVNAIPITGGTADDEGLNENSDQTQQGENTNSEQDADQAQQVTNEAQPQTKKQIRNQKREIAQDKVMKIVRAENRLRIAKQTGECPKNCTCTGSSMKCGLKEGRTMTIVAGKSGNTIVQVKGEDMATKVTLYKNEDKVYGIFKGNKTRIVKVMPDQVKEKIKEKIKAEPEEQEVELDEDGKYQIQSRKRARLFWVIPVKERVKVEMDSETGEITRTRTSWWGFLARDINLARDIKKEQIVGASCGTVTPGQNNACCQNKGFDYWNSEKNECLFYEGDEE